MKLRTIILTASLLSTGACATVMHGGEQSIAVNSTPVGAAINVDGQPMGTTPAVLRLARRDSHVLFLHLDGYTSYNMVLNRTRSGWVWGNIVFGGAIGLAVDARTGAMYKLTPTSVDLNMESRTAVIDGQRTIEVAIVMSADPSWEKIGQLSRE